MQLILKSFKITKFTKLLCATIAGRNFADFETAESFYVQFAIVILASLQARSQRYKFSSFMAVYLSF